MAKPDCPNCKENDKVVQTDDGNYGCQRCGDFFDKEGKKLNR
ncbi:hypothetical protein SAMN05444392_11613 [Seinonella peptonophila]|uniref:TFIIB-type domain-containing protein n=1 Tax=Seinonella peptonophila TaxID=112248 RepID=A0A1M5AUZ0_9BACL|nr:hypothetical protein [Seinonella peptonophila]SHF33946.1 hypothetical protein SAMN05444392_11613 [Seinonella peptonophila]